MKWILFFLIFVLGFYIFTQKKETHVQLEKDTTILAFGDSLTYGYGASEGMSYPSQLSKLLNLKVINRGISGEVSKDGLRRFEKTLRETKPNILILCHGGNDILRKYDLKQTKQNIKTMIELAKEDSVRVILVGVPKWNGLLGVDTADIYYELADETNVEFEDEILEDIMLDNSLKSDQIHPNDKGYQKMAEAFRDLILLDIS